MAEVTFDIRTQRFHATHSARIAEGDPATCWYCGRERAKCKRKLWYANARDAMTAADQVNGSAYDCPWCGGYHVTTTAGRVPDKGTT